jgi:hypothetical protein
VLAAALLSLPSAAHSAQERSACQKLSAKHDLAPAERVKLVETKNDGGSTTLKGCILPAGRIRIVASRYHGPPSGDYEIRQVAGHQVLLDDHFATGSSTNDSTDVFDIKRGARYSVASSSSGETAKRALINSGGQAVALVRGKGSDIVSVEGFSPRGNRVVLDEGTAGEIPASSLKLDGHVASWKHNGARKSARLPGVSGCQKLRAKDDLAPARRAKLVERANADGGKDLVGCVLPAGKVSVVASSAKRPALERTYQILQAVGHEVLVRGQVTNQYGRGVSTYVYDVKRARSYNVAESCFDEHGAACDQTYARRAFVNAQGQAAAIVRTDGSTEREVVGFKSTGAAKVLDTGTAAEIPASSLSLDGHVVRWTHSGAPKSATLSG